MSQFTAEQLVQMTRRQPAFPFGGENLIPEAQRLPAAAPQAAQTSAPEQQELPTGTFSAQDLAHMQAGTNAAVYAIDYSAPVPQVRRQIARLPEAMREDALRLWANHYVQREAETATGVDDRVRALARGTLIGSFLDEANAATQGALHSVTGGAAGAPYDETLAYNRARDRRFDRTNPLESGALQIAGGVGSFVPVLGAPASVAQAVGRGASYGAGAGALHGFGAGEGGFGNRVDTALSGAGYGTVFGAGFPIAAAGITRGAGLVRDTMAPTVARWRGGPDAAAENILAQRFERGGTTPAQVRLDLQQGQNSAVLHGGGATASRAPLPEMIADTSDAMRRLTGSVYRTGDEAGEMVRRSIEGRQRGPANPYAPQAGEPQGQLANLIETLDRSLLTRSSGTARQTEESIRATMRRQGDDIYNQARQNSEPFNLQGVLDSFAMQAMQYPPPFAARMQRALNLFSEPRPNGSRFPVTTIERFDNAKKALDDMISAAERGGNGNLMRLLTQFKNDLFGAVHAPGADGLPTRNVRYAEARQYWGNRQDDLAALELGRGALRETSEVTADAFRQLTARQQALFRIGLRDSARTALGSRRSGDDATRLFGQARIQELLAEVIPASNRGVFANRPERFGDLMSRNQRMVQTRNEVLGNSKTAQRMQDDTALAGDALSQMYNRFRQSPSVTNLAIEAVATTLGRVFSFRQDVAQSLARRLLTTDRGEQNRILRGIQQRMRDREGLATFAQFLDRMAIALGAGTAMTAVGGS